MPKSSHQSNVASRLPKKATKMAPTMDTTGSQEISTPYLATFPDEILVKIFHQVDSVTRKRSERVCRRWHGLLRQTPSLQHHLIVDTNPPNPQRVNLSQLLVRTLDGLLPSSRQARTLCFTGESDSKKPWLENGASHGLVQFGDLRTTLTRHLRHTATAITTIVLRMLSVTGKDLLLLLETLDRAEGWTVPPRRISSILFCQVKVKNLVRKEGLRSAEHDSLYGLVRRISGQITFANTGSSFVVQLAALLSAGDGPLSAQEYAEYRNAIRQSHFYWFAHPGSGNVMNFCNVLLGRTVSQSKGVNGDALPPFFLRLIIAEFITAASSSAISP